jgi:hypothetical protein
MCKETVERAGSRDLVVVYVQFDSDASTRIRRLYSLPKMTTIREDAGKVCLEDHIQLQAIVLDAFDNKHVHAYSNYRATRHGQQ